MISDLNELPNDCVVEGDLAIVGAGPAGIALASEFKSTNLQIILVEGGGLEIENASQDLNDADSIGLLHRERKSGRARVFGGTAKFWAGQCLRLNEIDFTDRPWVPYSGWPFGITELAPYYKRAEAFFRVDGETYDGRIYEKFHIDPPRWLQSKLSSMATEYTPDVDTGHVWKERLASAGNVQLLLHPNVVNIAVDCSGSAFSYIDVRSLDQKRAKVKARAAVLCAGGLENPRLLLLSRCQHAEGLGNANGQVGRFFQEHPNGFTADVVTDAGTAAVLQQKFRMFYGKNGGRHYPKFRLAEQTQKSAEVLNCTASLLFEYPEESGIAALQEIFRGLKGRRVPDGLFRKLLALVRNSPDVLQAILLRARSGRSPVGQPSRIRLQCYLEQAPTPESRVILSDRNDALGIPRLAVDWHLKDLEIRTLRILTETVRSEFARLALGEVRAAEWLSLDSGWQSHLSDCGHHCGTTRMSEDPQQGVVDSNCRVFGIDRLYIAGSSVFPTSGFANPTLTIVALSIRLADHLKRVLGH
jgi:choline dehydrogenase-like flavoprotein